jgi:alpha-mannosidase
MVEKPAVHLICGAHLDPVWQWRWEEGAAEAVATFGTAVELLNEHPGLVFCHNEAWLYRRVESLDPALFRQILRLARAGRWAISGGWYLQPDVNLPGLESIIRQIAEGRLYFREKFGVVPRVAYNFDSFGHSGGLPQILARAGYKMYIHMRPQANELGLPADLYRWRGVDGSEMFTCRIVGGLYHSEYDNIEQKIEDGIAMALKLGRDVPVFWGIGDHGGGATRADLEKIGSLIRKAQRVRILHSSPDRFYEAVKTMARTAPVFEGDLQRCFTGCYTSLSRLKREAATSLGLLVQSETLGAAAWWKTGRNDPGRDLTEAWRGQLFNDFHDIISGSCVEPAERDALDLYGKVEEEARRSRLGAAAAFNKGPARKLAIPLTVLSANPALTRVPVEVECMANYRPLWKGSWHLRLFKLDGAEIPCQEEQPEALLPFNGWRRKIAFLADLPGVGAAHYEIKAFEGKQSAPPPSKTAISAKVDKTSGLVTSFMAGRRECLRGPLLQPLMIEDDGDSWGTNRWSYRKLVAAFTLQGPPRIIESGGVRTITESIFRCRKSRIVVRVIAYPDWPALEFRFRILWNEERKRLALSTQTIFKEPSILAEIPGGAIARPAGGQEHVHGRWLMIEGQSDDERTALGLVNSGQHGFSFADGELHLSILRSSAYCHERGLKIAGRPVRKYADIGVHDIRFLVIAGNPAEIRRALPGLADWLDAPPFALAHLPIGTAFDGQSLVSISPRNIRMTACKRSWDGKALILRLHEASGIQTTCRLSFRRAGPGSSAEKAVRLHFKPFEIKTLRFDRPGSPRAVNLIDEE